MLKDIWKNKKDGIDGDIIYAEDSVNGGINQIAASAVKSESVIEDIVILPKPGSEVERIIEMEAGSIDIDTGQLVDSSSRIRSADFIPVKFNFAYTFSNDMNYNMYLMSYDADKKFLWHDSTSRGAAILVNDASSVKYIKIRTSSDEYDLSTVFKVSHGEPAQGYEVKKLDKLTTQLLNFGNGYSLSTTEMDPGLWQLQVSKEAGSEFNIFAIKTPPDKPYEATLALSQKGGRTRQFVDFSSMRYDESVRGTVEIVCQVRGETTPLPQFSVRFNDGNGAGRVRKFTVEPDCIPIVLTSTGLKVRRNNNYDNLDTDYITINLPDLLDQIETLNAKITDLESRMSALEV